MTHLGHFACRSIGTKMPSPELKIAESTLLNEINRFLEFQCLGQPRSRFCDRIEFSVFFIVFSNASRRWVDASVTLQACWPVR